ncbi:MAG TPA: hypothetical protein VGO66_07220 [Solirubrobacterales bacterium]|jgi:hypothetical protein|nr:hypothetical protein [Solirubrobacterales bacterium]
MSESSPEREERVDPIAEEEAEAAAAEAARIGGPTPDDNVDDPAQRPVAEGGEGEAEGFELAEEELIDRAEHGDQKPFPDSDAPPSEEPSGAVYGEADQEIDEDA